MQKYEQNRSKLNGMLVKNSDMEYDIKYYITGIIKLGLQRIEKKDIHNNHELC